MGSSRCIQNLSLNENLCKDKEKRKQHMDCCRLNCSSLIRNPLLLFMSISSSSFFCLFAQVFVQAQFFYAHTWQNDPSIHILIETFMQLWLSIFPSGIPYSVGAHELLTLQVMSDSAPPKPLFGLWRSRDKSQEDP
jgi:hypothetical protein